VSSTTSCSSAATIVDDVGLARAALLPAVGLVGDVVGAHDRLDVDLGAVGLHHRHERL
jgi:hypothetical protein